SGPLVSRCTRMSLVERNGIDFSFHTNTGMGETDGLRSDPCVNLGFPKNSTGSLGYCTPAFKARVRDLRGKIHDGDPEDPRLAVIKVFAKSATYAPRRGTALSRGLEISKGAITGNTANTNKLRELIKEEPQAFRTSQQLTS
ncbi:hypothetical protein HOY82DRAFT_477149, partial [Tuber indicum]